MLSAAACLVECRTVAAQSDLSVELVVPSGRPLRVMLTDNTTVHRVGQTVTGRLIEPVYAYDRIVLPVGTLVQGRITKLTTPSKTSRIRSMGSGDFSPHRAIELRFESVIRNDEPTPIQSIAKNETPHVKRAVARNAETPSDAGTVARTKAEAKARASAAAADLKRRASEAIAAVKEPGRMDRLKEWGIHKLAYYPQVLQKGTVYDAELLTSLTLGRVPPHPAAPQGTLPVPDSILTARLLTTLDSRVTPRGSPLEAIVSEPGVRRGRSADLSGRHEAHG
jgi:hypothetical protein